MMKPGTRVRLPECMRPYLAGREPSHVMTGTIRGVDDYGESYAVEMDGSWQIGHLCRTTAGVPLVPSRKGWWFRIRTDVSDALMPIETSKFEIAVADYISREIGGQS